MGDFEGIIVAITMIGIALFTLSTEASLAAGIVLIAFMMKGDND